MNSHPTLAAIAAAVGVSVMTVSKVLRGQGRISQAVRDRVRAEAERQGYHPNPHAVGLAKAKQSGAGRGTLALLVGHRDANPLTANPPHPLHYHYPRMVAGARARAAELGYGLDVLWIYEPGMSGRRLEEILRARGIDGLVLLSVQPRETDIDWERYACAALGRSDAVACAFADFFSVTRLAYMKTHEAGYRRIGLVIDTAHDRLSEGRCVGACAAAQPACAGAEWVRPLVVERQTLNVALLAGWMEAERPDAILFFRNEVPALLRDADSRDVGLVDLDLRTNDGKRAGIWMPHDRIGAAGVEMVNEQLQRGERGLNADAPARWLRGEWRDGATLANNRPSPC